MINYVTPRPTKTAVIDVGRTCQARCIFCYYVHSTDYNSWVPYEDLCSQVDAAQLRGNLLIDLTGGEPTIMPRIEEFVDYIHSKEMRVIPITNALINPEKIQGLIQKADLFRISMHNIEKINDEVMKVFDARKKQERFISALQKENNFQGIHVNMVLVEATNKSLPEFARYLVSLGVVKKFAIVTFLPHYEWGAEEKAITMVPDLRKTEPMLNEMIDILEENNIGVDVRYYPMCRVRKDLRRVVCNDLQCMFDPWEWDYGAFPKTLDEYRRVGENLSNSNEEKHDPCCFCKIKEACGGINRAMNRATKGQMIDAVVDEESNYFYYYRQYNLKTLIQRW